MSCSSLCASSCGVAATCPLADTCNEVCARQLNGSTVVIQPPTAVVTFPGPILSSSSQQSSVGSSGAPYVSLGSCNISGGRGSSGGFGGYGGSCGGSRGCGPC